MGTSSESIELQAPAKINLSFEIRGRRSDGFHEIETLMASVSLCDRLRISRSGETGTVSFACDDPTLPVGDDNLVVRAARLIFQAGEATSGVRIELEKKIPHGAGLGGGSSDAASTLLGMNELLGLGLPVSRLAELGAEIGSDVPFFLYRSAAKCEGRGEIVTPFQLERSLPLLLVKPGFGVPTPWAYSRWKDSKELPGILYGPQEFAGMRFVNDLERPVFEKHLFLAQTKMWLLAQAGVGAAMMSGSGSTLFALLHEGANAGALADRARVELDPEFWTCPCETL